MSFLGIEIGSSIDSNVSDYLGQHPVPYEWTKTRRDLDSYLENEIQSCGNFVHDKNPLHSRNRAEAICADQLNQAYADLIDQVQQQTAGEEAALKKEALAGNQKTYVTVAVVLIALIGIVVVFKD